MSYTIVGIHTGIGKTVCSAILCQALGFEYWKPVQAGDLDNSDSLNVRTNVTNPKTKIHPERYKLNHPVSPHRAAELDKVVISKEDFILPTNSNELIVETAGGVMSPLAKDFLNIDLVELLQLPVILVSNNYLGSINHTLLTYEAMKSRNIQLKGLVFVGESNPATEDFIKEYTQMPVLFNVPIFNHINPQQIESFAETITTCL